MLYVSIVSCSRTREIIFIYHVIDSQNEHPKKMGYHSKVHIKLHLFPLLHKIKFEYLMLLQNRSHFFKKKDWKTHVENHVQNPTIKFKNRWTDVEIKTVKTQTLNNNMWLLQYRGF